VAAQEAPPPREAAPPPPARPAPIAKTRKRVFTIDHADGSETTITVCGPAGAVKCNSTEQSVQVWTGDSAPAQPQVPFQQAGRGVVQIAPYSADIGRSGTEYTMTDRLDNIPGGLPPGMTEDEALSNPDAVIAALERTRLGMTARMSSESGSSDVLLVPEGAN
jgi:hypothetical protein